MNFPDYDVTHHTRKRNFLKQIDQLIDWNTIEKAIAVHYASMSDAAGRPAYSGLLLFKMLLVGIWNGGLSDESVEDMANSNLHAMRVIEVTQPGVDSQAPWVKKGGKSVFGYKQHTVVDNNGLVMAVTTTAANCHDSKPLLGLPG